MRRMVLEPFKLKRLLDCYGHGIARNWVTGMGTFLTIDHHRTLLELVHELFESSARRSFIFVYISVDSHLARLDRIIWAVLHIVRLHETWVILVMLR
jgi:hypothetical protein